MTLLKLEPVNSQVCRVLSASGEHVGNLKWIAGVWKFKAVGYGPGGEIVPGGGPLTGRHNATFAALDEALISKALLF
jgi:hypothetical protein